MTKQGWALAAGIVIGAGTMMALGMAQPSGQPSDLEARLDRLERAVLKPDSKLPEDPKQSIEAMLEQILASTQRTEAMFAALDEQRLDELAARIRFIHDSLLNVKIVQITDLERRVRDIERQFAGIGQTVRLEDVVRRVDQIERDRRIYERTADDNQRRIDRLLSDVQRMDRRVTRVESKIR